MTFEVENTDTIYKYTTKNNIQKLSNEFNYENVFVMGTHYSVANDNNNKHNKLLNFKSESCYYDSHLYANACMYIFQSL